MTLDLAQFHESFFQESLEALDLMESTLLQLDAGVPDPERVNTLFRGAHSIKGGSGMFGFTAITEVTHALETLLDGLRSGRLRASTGLSDLLLQAVDVIRGLLAAAQQRQPADEALCHTLVQQLAQAAQESQTAAASVVCNDPRSGAPAIPDSGAADAADASVPGVQASATPADAAPGRCWHIAFTPGEELLRRGNDPLRLFGELRGMGPLQVRADAVQVPPLARLEPHRCAIRWDLTLRTGAPREAIELIFEWAQGDCVLAIEESPDAPPARRLDGAADRDPAAAATAPAQDAEPPRRRAGDQAPVAERESADAIAGRQSFREADAASIRVSIAKIDELINAVGEMVITHSMLSQQVASLQGASAERLRDGLGQLDRNVRELQESVMRVRMLPINVVFSRFPRLVRDLAQRLDKQIELRLTGAQTELDKIVLERIGDPLVHLVRNSIDHGIEPPDVRASIGKPRSGTIQLDACHKGGAIRVEVRDDGRGLDKARILEKARAQGLIGPAELPSDEQIYNLIFTPGFSTAEKTTDVSGRGVGMDVVRRNIVALGGSIELRSEFGRGTCTSITLPLTLAIVDGQLIAVGTERYVVPLVAIVESMQLTPGAVARLAGRGEVVEFRGSYLPVVRLHQLFGIEPRGRSLERGLLMVVEGEGRRVGLLVDELLGQQQVVIKSLETSYRRIEGISGATILGEGAVALILDVAGLIRLASEQSLPRQAA